MKMRSALKSALGIAAVVIVVADLTGCGSSYRASGLIYHRQKNYDKAIEQLNLAVAQNPKDYVAQLTLAQDLAETGRWTEAAEHFKAARDASPAKAQEVDDQQGHYFAINYTQGATAYGAKDYDTAVKFLTAATQVAPDRAEGYSLLGATYSGMANKALQSKSDLPDDAQKAAADNAANEAFQKSIDNLTIATSKDPKDADSWMDLGQTQLRLKHSADAERSFQSALDATPADSVDKRVDIYQRLGDMSFVAGSELAPSDSVAKKTLFAKSCEQYAKAEELRPNDPRTQYQLGLCNFNQGRFAEASGYFGKAADLSEGGQDKDLTCDAIYNSGLAAMNGGQPEKTIQAGDRLLQSCSDSNPKYYVLRAQGKRALADQLQKQGKTAEAKQMTNDAVADFQKANSLSGGD